MKLLVDVLFWALLTVVVFAGCYWLTSEVSGLLARLAPATGVSMRSLVLGSSLVLTPCALVGITHFLTRK